MTESRSDDLSPHCNPKQPFLGLNKSSVNAKRSSSSLKTFFCQVFNFFNKKCIFYTKNCKVKAFIPYLKYKVKGCNEIL